MKAYSRYATSLVVMAVVLGAATPSLANPADDAWDSFLGGNHRFQLLDGNSCPGGEAVLDKETGLVWERTPDTGAFVWGSNPFYANAATFCMSRVVCNRKGWRVPTVQEATSLYGVCSPPGGASSTCLTTATFPQEPNPFNINSGFLGQAFWTATTDAGGTPGGGSHTDTAYTVQYFSGAISEAGKLTLNHAWCVRFRQGVDPQ